MDGMTIAEIIEYLKTLNQDYILEIEDSEYPNTPFTKECIEVDHEAKRYSIY
jgi:hypothetical protein